jgi:hypothetical protein
MNGAFAWFFPWFSFEMADYMLQSFFLLLRTRSSPHCPAPQSRLSARAPPWPHDSCEILQSRSLLSVLCSNLWANTRPSLRRTSKSTREFRRILHGSPVFKIPDYAPRETSAFRGFLNASAIRAEKHFQIESFFINIMKQQNRKRLAG